MVGGYRSKLVFLLLIALLFLISACSKPECKVAADCGANSNCITYGCSAEGACMKNVRPNCCGNMKCEDGAGETRCNCKDCGSCGGKVTYNTTTSRGVKAVDTKYAIYLCNDAGQCVAGANPDLTTELKLTSIVEERNYFKLDLLSTLPSAFNTATDSFSLRVTLGDLNSQTVAGGVSISSIQILSGNFLMSEAQVNRDLASVGSSFIQEFRLGTAQTLPEEELPVSIKVYYSYLPKDSKGNTLPVKRSSQSVSLGTKVPFIKP